MFASTIEIPTDPIQTADSTSNQHTSRPNEPQVLNATHNNQSRTSTLIRNSQLSPEPSPIIINPPLPPPPLPRRGTKRSLSKYRPQVSVRSI